MNQDIVYDFIVVGSGAGGGPLAGNLAKAGYRVCVLEAGKPPVNSCDYKVPVFHTKASEDPEIRWDFFVRHYDDLATQKRDSKFTHDKDGVLYPRCSTVGGCTAHNAMITVYPHNSDWDDLAALTGDDSWCADRMQKYFHRLEDCRYRPIQKFFQKIFGGNPSRHGFGGWLTTEAANPKLVLGDGELLTLLIKSSKEAFLEIANPFMRLVRTAIRFFKSGFDLRAALDPNDWEHVRQSAVGLRFAPLATKNGIRQSTREYLLSVQRALPDYLTIQTGALATRVLFDDTDKTRAVGVEYYKSDHKLYRADRDPVPDAPYEIRSVYAKHEVILAGGAYNSPQLLMLSGIGDREYLQDPEKGFTIDCRIDLPGVGRNLQDRYEVGVVSEMNDDFVLLKGAKFDGVDDDPLYKAWEQHKGPYTTNGAVIALIKRSKPERPEPDLFVFGLVGYFKGYYPGYSKDALNPEKLNRFTWAVLKAHTQNTAGYVKLRSKDPRDTPYISFRYFDEGNDPSREDLESVLEGVKLARQMMARSRHLIKRELVPGPEVETDDQLRQFIKDNAWGHHASCSNKMGATGDVDAVVDGNFCVHGAKNLRVVDASVFPKIPGFFIVSSVYMISEKASDVIITDAKRKDREQQS